MKRIIFVVIALAVAGYFVHSYVENKAMEKAKHEAERKRSERLRKARQAAIAKMVARFGAIDDWDKKLSKKGHGEGERILTIELEKHWITDKPILFKGDIEDVASSDRNNYLIQVDGYGWEQSLRDAKAGEKSVYFSTKLSLSLTCPKTMIDSFLDKGDQVLSFGGYGMVAVIAKISRIESRYLNNREEEGEETRVGIGKCLDMVYMDSIREDLLGEGGQSNE